MIFCSLYIHIYRSRCYQKLTNFIIENEGEDLRGEVLLMLRLQLILGCLPFFGKNLKVLSQTKNNHTRQQVGLSMTMQAVLKLQKGDLV